ncbi:MAG: carbohydrate kinase family protein [Eubacteriales bacterium]
MNGIVFAGNLIVDHIKKIKALPSRSELSKILGVKESTGGCVCNTGIDFATLDPSADVKAVGVVGNDTDGDIIIEAMKSHGIDTDGIIRRGTTSFTDVFFEESSNCRTFFQYGGACDDFDIDDVDIENLDCRMFHIGYILLLNRLDSYDAEYGTRMARLLKAVQDRGIETSVDVVSESGDRFRRIVTPALKYVDYLIINETEAERTCGIQIRESDGGLNIGNMKKALSELLGMGVGKWAVIHCREGAFGLDRDGNYAEEPSKRLPHGYIVGTVGAGDAFCAGVLLAAYRNKSIDEALVFGNASAQMSLRSETATGSMRGIEEAISEYNRY